MNNKKKSDRKNLMVLSVGAWIRAQREGQLKISLASKLRENGYSINHAYVLAKSIIKHLEDDKAIHISKSGQLTLKRKLDAQYIGDMFDKTSISSKEVKVAELTTMPVTTSSNITSFSDSELIEELRRRGWNVTCVKSL